MTVSEIALRSFLPPVIQLDDNNTDLIDFIFFRSGYSTLILVRMEFKQIYPDTLDKFYRYCESVRSRLYGTEGGEVRCI